MSRKHWCVSALDKQLAADICDKHDLDLITGLLLVAKGITNDDEIQDFFSEEYFLSDPFEIKDMQKAVDRINFAIDNGEKIAIYGDYDADGVTATSLLKLYFEFIGVEVMTYIPSREGEGYGLNCKAIDELNSYGVNLIITVDNGIAAIEESKYIASLGIDLIVTDHHKVLPELPTAVAVVNPHREDDESSFKDFCGAGIAFKLMCALCDGEYEEMLDSFSDIAAIGTIADLVSLKGENRILVRKGLELINNKNNLGIQALRRICKNEDKVIDSGAVAFQIAPRINALGRIDDANEVVDLLTSDSLGLTQSIASTIGLCNDQRKELEEGISFDIENKVDKKAFCEDVLVFSGKNWHAGVIGISCAKLVEKFGKPCIIISEGEDEARASARSIDGFSIYDAIASASDLLTHFGGHPMAAGFSLKNEDIPEFKKRIKNYCKLTKMPFAKFNIDLKLRPDFISTDILDSIEIMQPFGQDNKEPVFGLYGMEITKVAPLGKEQQYVKFNLKRDDANINAVCFSLSPNSCPYIYGDKIDLAVKLKRNVFRGTESVSIFVEQIRMSETDDLLYLKNLRIYDKIKRGEKPSKQTAQRILPTREDIAKVFKLVKSTENGWRHDYDLLCYRLGDNGENVAKYLLAIDILLELEVFERELNHIRIVENKKVNLNDSKILAYLKSLA